MTTSTLTKTNILTRMKAALQDYLSGDWEFNEGSNYVQAKSGDITIRLVGVGNQYRCVVLLAPLSSPYVLGKSNGSMRKAIEETLDTLKERLPVIN